MRLSTINQSKRQRFIRQSGWIFIAIVGLNLSGCNGGATAPPSPARFTGRYIGTLTATYDPRSPLTGTITRPLDFTVSSSGAVTVVNPFPLPPDNLSGSGSVDSNGTLTATAGTSSFGIRTLTGQLSLTNGTLSGSGTITVANQSELAYGTWQASVPMR